MLKLIQKLFKKDNTVLVRTEDYKTVDQLTEDDYWFIDMDRAQTGLNSCSDEYYYNHILNYNFKLVEKTA